MIIKNKVVEIVTSYNTLSQGMTSVRISFPLFNILNYYNSTLQTTRS